MFKKKRVTDNTVTLEDLPDEVLVQICNRLDRESLTCFMQVSKSLAQFLQHYFFLTNNAKQFLAEYLHRNDESTLSMTPEAIDLLLIKSVRFTQSIGHRINSPLLQLLVEKPNIIRFLRHDRVLERHKRLWDQKKKAYRSAKHLLKNFSSSSSEFFSQRRVGAAKKLARLIKQSRPSESVLFDMAYAELVRISALNSRDGYNEYESLLIYILQKLLPDVLNVGLDHYLLEAPMAG